MKALTVFQIYEGSGEWFDLSKKPIERASFTFFTMTLCRIAHYFQKVDSAVFSSTPAILYLFRYNSMDTVMRDARRYFKDGNESGYYYEYDSSDPDEGIFCALVNEKTKVKSF